MEFKSSAAGRREGGAGTSSRVEQPEQHRPRSRDPVHSLPGKPPGRCTDSRSPAPLTAESAADGTGFLCPPTPGPLPKPRRAGVWGVGEDSCDHGSAASSAFWTSGLSSTSTRNAGTLSPSSCTRRLLSGSAADAPRRAAASSAAVAPLVSDVPACTVGSRCLRGRWRRGRDVRRRCRRHASVRPRA